MPAISSSFVPPQELGVPASPSVDGGTVPTHHTQLIVLAAAAASVTALVVSFFIWRYLTNRRQGTTRTDMEAHPTAAHAEPKASISNLPTFEIPSIIVTVHDLAHTPSTISLLSSSDITSADNCLPESGFTEDVSLISESEYEDSAEDCSSILANFGLDDSYSSNEDESDGNSAFSEEIRAAVESMAVDLKRFSIADSLDLKDVGSRRSSVVIEPEHDVPGFRVESSVDDAVEKLEAAFQDFRLLVAEQSRDSLFSSDAVSEIATLELVPSHTKVETVQTADSASSLFRRIGDSDRAKALLNVAADGFKNERMEVDHSIFRKLSTSFPSSLNPIPEDGELDASNGSTRLAIDNEISLANPLRAGHEDNPAIGIEVQLTDPTILRKPSKEFSSTLNAIHEDESNASSGSIKLVADDESTYCPSLQSSQDDRTVSCTVADESTGGSLYGFAETAGMSMAAALGKEEYIPYFGDSGLYGMGLPSKGVWHYTIGSWREDFEEEKESAEGFGELTSFLFPGARVGQTETDDACSPDSEEIQTQASPIDDCVCANGADVVANQSSPVIDITQPISPASSCSEATVVGMQMASPLHTSTPISKSSRFPSAKVAASISKSFSGSLKRLSPTSQRSSKPSPTPSPKQISPTRPRAASSMSSSNNLTGTRPAASSPLSPPSTNRNARPVPTEQTLPIRPLRRPLDAIKTGVLSNGVPSAPRPARKGHFPAPGRNFSPSTAQPAQTAAIQVNRRASTLNAQSRASQYVSASAPRQAWR
ncbi:hypothetical protein DFH11DRAFT_1573040 [Phellopilus nigrolimitatus]|nr:hypothetical protein DFH11DRAFT_1573040 [Phellopilus nigrolimitatus]